MTRPAHVLISYWLFKDANRYRLIEQLPDHREMFVDSGAYSAYNSGAEIAVGDYCDWLNNHPEYATYAALDVIGDPQGSYANYKTMRSEGLKPIPVFHGGEPWNLLHRYIEDGNDYIAFGGMARAQGSLRWCAEAFSHIPPNVRIHGFGQTKLAILRALPWYSVDSTTFSGLARWANVQTFNGRSIATVRLGKYASIKSRPALAKAIRSISDEYSSIAVLDTDLDRNLKRFGSGTARARHATYAGGRMWARVEETLIERHGRIGGDGPKVYLAINALQDTDAVRGQLEYFTERGIE